MQHERLRFEYANALFLQLLKLSEEDDCCSDKFLSIGDCWGSIRACYYENLYSPSKHGRQQTINNTNDIKQL